MAHSNVSMSIIKKAMVCALFIPSLLLGQEEKKPNIILFMTDDMGIECLSIYGGETYKTPHLDKLAKDGMRFNHCYSQPLCTPSRVKIMTGRYNFRNYTEFKHLDPSQRTIGHVARSAGYKTAVVGKWQLDGSMDDDFAKEFGFDHYCLWYLNEKNFGSRYLHPKLVADGKVVGGQGLYGPDICNEFALKFIEENKNENFLLYYPMILPHFPFEATPDSKDWNPNAKKVKKKNEYYVDMVQYADKLVGKVVRKIEELGLADDTIIMFTSDNGTMRGLHSTWRGGVAYPGGKGRLDNTGCHVPLIVRWDKVAKNGQVKNELVDFSDFFATIQELTGGAGPKDYKIDGRSFVGLLKGDKSYVPRAYTFCHYNPKWGTPETGNFARTQTLKVYGADGRYYDISKDYFEKNKLIEVTPENKDQINALKKILSEMKAQGSNPPIKFSRGRDSKKKKNN